MGSPGTSGDRSGPVARAVEWLRAGHPTGMPRRDYVVLLAILRRTLTEEEVRQLAAALVGHRPAGPDGPGGAPLTRADVESAIRDSVLQPPSDEDVARVCAHPAAQGWPAGPPT